MNSWYPTNMFTNAGPSGEPIATPSVCLYIVSLKLNSTDDVALSISSIDTAWGMGGAEEGSLYKASAHMLIVSLRGTLVNRLRMSNCAHLTSQAYLPMYLSRKRSAYVRKPCTKTLLPHLPFPKRYLLNLWKVLRHP